LVVHSDFLGWEHVSLLTLVESATGHRAAVDNDVQSLTMAHHWFGAGVGLSSFALLVFGEGIGGGIVVNGELLRGAHGRPGKLDHLPTSDTGPLCDRGHVGCLSAYATTSAVSRNAGQGDAGYSEALRRARSGDELSLRAFRDAGTAVGAAVASVSNLLDPEKVILTGEGLAIFDLAADEFADGVRARVNPLAKTPIVDVQKFSFQDYAWAAAIGAIRRVV